MSTCHTPGMFSSLRQDWATPRALFEMLDREFHFTLDVCATTDTATTLRFIHKDEDALGLDWEALAVGGAVWINPPYGRRVGDWVEKAYRTSTHGATVVCLLAARSDTSWFHNYCLKAEIRFLRGRLCFDDKRKGRCPFPSMIVVFRPPEK